MTSVGFTTQFPRHLLDPETAYQHEQDDSLVKSENQNYVILSQTPMSPSHKEKRDHLKSRLRSPSSTNAMENVVQDTGDSLQLADNEGTRSKKALEHDTQCSSPGPLHLFIRGVMQSSAAGPEHSQFLPFNELDSIVTIPNIRRELQFSDSGSDPDVVSRQVWNCETLYTGEKTTRRKLFVVFCLMEKAEYIESCIEEGLFDTDLPFEFEQNQGFSRTGTPVKLFASWKLCDIDSFRNYQGQVMAPYFKLSNDSFTEFREYKLHQCVVLPFVDHEIKLNGRENSALDFKIQREGGYSVVRKVRMHSAHHDRLCSFSNQSPPEKMYYAIKELRKQDDASKDLETEPDRETTAYKYLNCRRHPHIIQLLATFTQKGHLNMIFPWADANLMEFWEFQFPRTCDLPRNVDLARWLVQQFLGLAEAIHCIHHSNASLFLGHNNGPQDWSKTHGRHGDLKPENILWFRNGSSTGPHNPHGILVVSDLGSTEFHATRSKTVRAEAAGGYTHTYKAPEFDKMHQVAPKADIWSLGCVLLQFLVWYVDGWDGIDKFAKARSKDSNLYFHADHFFNFNQKDSTVVVKASVQNECSRLRASPATTEMVLDLLNFVEYELLQLNPSRRAPCDAILEMFRIIQRRCLQNSDYCMERTLKAVSRAPTDQSHKTTVSLSPEMQEEYFLNIDPNVYPLSSGSATANSIRTTRDVDRGDNPKDMEDASSPCTPPGTTDAFNTHEHTWAGFAATLSINKEPLTTDEGSETISGHVNERHRHMFKRMWIRVRSSLKGNSGLKSFT